MSACLLCWMRLVEKPGAGNRNMEAVEKAQDNLAYDEPPARYYSVASHRARRFSERVTQRSCNGIPQHAQEYREQGSRPQPIITFHSPGHRALKNATRSYSS